MKWRGVVLYKFHAQTGVLSVKLPSGAYKSLIQCKDKNAEYIQIEFQAPGQPRTTGDKSQNHAINGFCQQIAQETGQPFESVKMAMKEEAISRGYPFDIESMTGRIIPWSESRLNTEQAAILIETIKQVAAEFGIILEE